MRLEELEGALRELAGQSAGMTPKRDATRRTLLACAVERFSELGIRKTTMEDIASAAGMSRGTLYTYAKNRDELLLMCLAEASLLQLETHSKILAPELPPDVRLEELIVSKILAFRRSPILAKMIEGDMSVAIALQSHPRFLEIFGSPAFDEVRNLASWIKIAAPHLNAEDIKAVDAALQALLISGPALLRSADQLGHPPEPVIRTIAKTFVAGLRPTKNARRRP